MKTFHPHSEQGRKHTAQMTKQPNEDHGATASLVAAENRTVDAAGAQFIYRELGNAQDESLPLVGLTHLGANLDSWDPELIDPIAATRRVILIGYRGVGASTGTPQDNFEAMVQDAIATIRALGLAQIDLFGLSMGGMVALEVLRQAPELVNRVVFAGTGPQSGPGLTQMTKTFIRGVLRGAITLTNPTSVLFFTKTDNGKQAAKEYQARLMLRSTGRDKPVAPNVLVAQLRAVKRWGQATPVTLGFAGPVLDLHGDSDAMVFPENTEALKRVLPQTQVQIYPDAGHGVVSQHRASISQTITKFLSR